MSERCSLLAAGEPLAGTAPAARAWLVIEQPGPWGRKALLDSRLEIGPELHERTVGTGVAVILARRAGSAAAGGRRFWLAHPASGGGSLRTGITDDRRLLDIDFAGLARGQLPALGERDREPWLFVCTHSGRDACCAILGRALLGELNASMAMPAERIWECSHLGGHRFAPSVLALPSGAVYGRVDAAEAASLCEATSRGALLVHRLRGRAGVPAPLQAAEAEVRARHGIDAADALDPLQMVDGRAVPPAGDPTAAEVGESVLAEVRHADGRAWRVAVRRERLADARPESCGAEPVPAYTWHAAGAAPAADWRTRR